MPKPQRDLTNKRFGKLIAIRINGQLQKRTAWLCKCDCGKEITVRATSLLANYTTSCGCHRDIVATKNIEGAAFKHGQAGKNRTPEYTTWARMIQRCHDKNDKDYRVYGGAGIIVCKRWRFGEEGQSGFECFLKDMGMRPAPNYTLDRFPDKSGNYEKENCRWATRKEQAQNTRRNTWITYEGKTMLSEDWSKLTGLDPATIRNRLRLGWTTKDTLTKPLWSRKSSE